MDLLIVDTKRRKRNREEGDTNCLGPQRAMNPHILLLSGVLPLIPIGSFAYAWSHDCFRERQTLRSCGSCIGSPEKNCFCFLSVCSSVGRLTTKTIPPKGTVYILSLPNLSHIVLEENKTLHSGLYELGLDLLSRDKTVAWGKSKHHKKRHKV